MDEIEKIHIKLELCKDKSSGLTIIAHFDPEAPNFKKEGEKFTWFPNNKEKHFIKEAFDLISNTKNCNLEEDNYLKFSINQQTLDDQYKNEEDQKENNLSNDELDTEKNKELKSEEQTQHNNETTKDSININEKEIQAIDKAIQKQTIKEENTSENDKKIIEKILNKKR